MSIEDMLKKLAPLIGERAERLWLLYQTESDYEARREIETSVNLLAARFLDDSIAKKEILQQPPEESNSEGILLGKVFYGKEPRQDFYLKEDELLQHLAVMGMTGAGKTDLLFLLTKQLLEKSIPFTIFSWKREYRDLILMDWPGVDRLELYTVGRNIAPFSFNPFRAPPGVPKQVWNFRLADILAETAFLGHGARYILHELLQADSEPTFQSLFGSLMKQKAIGRKRQWLDSTVRAVGDLCIGPTKETFNDTQGQDLSDVLNRTVVFELDSLSNDAKAFFVASFLAWTHLFRLYSGKKEKLLHVNIIEEAHHVLRKRNDFAENETVMDLVFREIRELGESLIISDQHPSLLSKPSLGNSGSTIVLRLKHGDDIRAAVNSTLIQQQDRDYFGMLQTGWAIVKSPSQESPFLIKIPYIPVEKGKVGDDLIQRRFLSYSIAKGDIQPFQKVDNGIPPIRAEDKKEDLKSETLNEIELQFLKDVDCHNTSGIVERYERLKLSRGKGNAIKNRLLDLGFIKEVSVPAGGYAVKCLLLTETGVENLLNAGIVTQENNFSKKLGGPEHRYWVNKISRELEGKGIKVEKEYPLEGKQSVDLVAQNGNRKIAIEIETGKSDIKKNMVKSSDRKVNTLIFVPTNGNARKKILEILLRKNNLS